LRDSYYSRVSDSLAKLSENNEQFYDLLNGTIQKVFEKAYVEKLSKVYDKSKEANNLEKRRMLIRFKHFMFRSRILTYTSEEIDRQLHQLENMPLREVHLQETMSKSFRDSQHPDI